MSNFATRSELHKIAQTIIVQHQADTEGTASNFIILITELRQAN